MSATATLGTVPTPQTAFFSDIPDHLGPFAYSILGLISTPVDQPRLSKVVMNLASSILSFVDAEPHLGKMDELLIQNCRELVAFAKYKCKFDQTAFGQIEGRLGDYPEWALCMLLDPVQGEIATPMGAEVWLALMEHRKLRTGYVRFLRQDLDKLPTPEARAETLASDLVAMSFGKYWQRPFERIRKRLSKKLASKSNEPWVCWRQWNIDQLCRLNFDQGLRLPPQEVSCG